MTPQEELGIIENCQKGSSAEFCHLYDSYIKKIYAFIFFKVHNKEIAEDLTSDTFLKALEKIKSYDPRKGKFSSWLYQIARNKVIDHFRKKKPVWFRAEDIWDLQDNTDIEGDMELKTKLEKVKSYLKTLNPQQREIITMRIWDDLSFEEISQALKKTESSCKMVFYRAISNLRKEAPLLLILGLSVINYVEGIFNNLN